MPKKPRLLLVTAGFLVVACLACWAAQKSGPLTYRLDVKPGDITLPPKPAAQIPAAQLEEAITFTVSNSSDTDYEGTAPSCQISDVEIFWSGPSGEKSVWKWSDGQMFCQKVTPVIIPAGLNWQQTVKWDFNPADAARGSYRVAATFIPSNAVASASFEIH
jgi:hypothetical protein